MRFGYDRYKVESIDRNTISLFKRQRVPNTAQYDWVLVTHIVKHAGAGLQYKRTPEFTGYMFGKSPATNPFMLIGANSPKEAVEKFNRYVGIGRQVGAYEW